MTPRAADVQAEQDADNPGAAVGFVALAVLVSLAVAATVALAWFIEKVLP